MSDIDQFDITRFEHVKDYAKYLEIELSETHDMQDDMEEYLFGVWDEENDIKKKNSKARITIHPGAQNDLMGAIRLLIAADPEFSVPTQKNDPEAKIKSDKIEKMAKSLWHTAGEIRGDPIHYNVVLSMLTFGETHIRITRSKDVLDAANDSEDEIAMERAEEVANATPILFDVTDPRLGFPDYDPATGMLAAFYSKATMSLQSLISQYPNARKVLDVQKGSDDWERNPFQQRDVHNFWDHKYRHVWIDGVEPPLVQEKLATPFIPIICQTGEGSRMFSKQLYWRRPFLYTVWNTNIQKRQNLMLTVFYTLVYALGANATFLYKANMPDKKVRRDFSTIGGDIIIEKDEEYGPLLKNVVDRSLMEAMEVGDRLEMESTIYSQTLGEPLGKNAPFSMVALLHQAGRLPLVVPQRKSNWAIASAVKCALEWLRKDSKKIEAGFGDKYAELTPSELPKRYTIEAILEISLPQDKLNNANIANAITQGDYPLASRKWARENILNIGQSDEMQQEIWDEKSADLDAMNYFIDQQLAIRQKLAALRTPPEGGAVPGVPGGMEGGGEPPPPGGGGGMPNAEGEMPNTGSPKQVRPGQVNKMPREFTKDQGNLIPMQGV